jgi:hypothetical protein
LAVPVAVAHQGSRVVRPPKGSVLVAVAAQPRVVAVAAQPRARRATRAVWPRDRPTNTHVARDLWNSDARILLLSETINAAGGLNQRFAESAAFDRVDRVMPAGAFAASGPSGQTRSKTRSRIAQVRAARVCARVVQILRVSAQFQLEGSPADKTVVKNFWGDEGVRFAARVDMNSDPGCTRMTAAGAALDRSSIRAPAHDSAASDGSVRIADQNLHSCTLHDLRDLLYLRQR